MQASAKVLGATIVGWGWDPASPGARLRVSARVDTTPLQETIAMAYKSDLERSGIGDGRHSFSLPIPANFQDGEMHDIAVDFLADGEKITININTLIRSRTPIIFTHIPKTGGTSLRHLIQQQFSPHEIFPDENMIRRNAGLYPSPVSLTVMSRTEVSSIRFIRGHYHTGVRQLIPTPSRLITILRNPVDRTVSHVNHIMRHSKKFAKSSFEDVLLADPSKAFRNFQTRFFCIGYEGIRRTCPDSSHTNDCWALNRDHELTESDFQEAKKNLDQYEFVGDFEDLEQFGRAVMQIMFDVKIDSVPKSNVTYNNGEVSDQHVKIIEDANKFDFRLYDYARKLWQDRRNSLRPGERRNAGLA